MKTRIFDPAKPLFKRFDSEIVIKSIDEATRTIWHPITREVTDRLGDIVRLAGANLENFKRKPAVLYGHDYQGFGKAQVPIIARNVGFEPEGDTLFAGTQFLAPDGLSADLVDLINDNWTLHVKKLMGWSIGFRVTKWAEIRDAEHHFVGYDFQEWELLEYSSVIIPAHQDAVDNAIKAGIVKRTILDLGFTPADTTEPDPPKVESRNVAAAPHADNPPAQDAGKSKSNGDNMNLEDILKKVDAGEALTDEEAKYLAKMRTALAPPAAAAAPASDPPAAPVRRLDLSDGNGRGTHVRSISKIMGFPSRLLSEEERAVRDFVDDAVILGTMLKKSPVQTKFWQERYGLSSALQKAMDTATAAEGAEWVPTALSADFIEKFRFGSRIASLFPDIAMPTNPFKLPYTGGLGADSFYLVGESLSDSPAAPPAVTLATGAQTLTAKKLKARIYFSEEITEASIVPLLPHLRAEIIQAGAEAIDDCVLNGDTTATHQDSDVTDSKDRRKIWDGLRDQCPSGTKVDLGTFATTTLLSIVTAMGKYGITPQDLALITGPTGYNKLRLLTEVLTVDKYGPQATILNGELAKISGIPIILSEAVRQNLNATGVYDGSTMTKTIALIVNRKAAILGSWMQAKMTYKEDAEVDQNQLILRFYKAMAYRWTPSSTVTTIGLAYNIA